MSTAWPKLATFAWRFALAQLVLGALAYRYGATLVAWLLPAWHAEINWLDDTYRIEQLAIDQDGADQVVRIVVSLAHCVLLAGQAYCGDPAGRAAVSTLLGHVGTASALLVGVVLAWPVSHPSAYVWRFAGLVPALALMWALDLPFVLWASLWGLHVDAFAPDVWSPLLSWRSFLQSGGRLALALSLGALVVRLVCRVERERAIRAEAG